jgi:hypothetical protein
MGMSHRSDKIIGMKNSIFRIYDRLKFDQTIINHIIYPVD